MTAPRPNFPGIDTTHKPEPPKLEVRQIFDYGIAWPADSCKERTFLGEIRFEPAPQLNKTSKIYVRLKSCCDFVKKPESVTRKQRNDIVINVHADENLIDFTQLEPKWFPPIKKGDIYEGSITIVPREIGTHGICIFIQEFGEFCFNFGFYENGQLAYISDRGSIRISDMFNHPAITDKETYVKFDGKYVTNLFHIYPPLSLKDTSTVDYRVVTKVDYPEGLKLVTRDGSNISFKMIPGPINKGDTLTGSFKEVPPRVGWNSIGLGIEEPPREGIRPRNDSFSAQYNLLKDGKLLFIAKGQEEYNTFFNYYAKKGVQLEK
ncbi:MAG TPA: hypothetical protein VMT04_01020 [Terriglobales bacterium]|nr:hypothetical protein [Terriglobales bacterium]